jgi:hypothetical protein
MRRRRDFPHGTSRAASRGGRCVPAHGIVGDHLRRVHRRVARGRLRRLRRASGSLWPSDRSSAAPSPMSSAGVDLPGQRPGPAGLTGLRMLWPTACQAGAAGRQICRCAGGLTPRPRWDPTPSLSPCISTDRKGIPVAHLPRASWFELSEQPMTQPDAWRMIRRRAVAVGIFCADRQSFVSGDGESLRRCP